MLLLHRLSPDFFPASLTRQRLLGAFFFSGFQIEGVFLDFLDDVFLLDFSFETPQRIFDRFTILNPNLCQ